MNIDAIPLFSMLRSRLGYITQREQVISQNVANSDTPGYTPRDLKGFSFTAELGAAGGQGGMGGAGKMEVMPVLPGHVALKPTHQPGAFQMVKRPDSETTLDGNQVVLEDQMVKMNQARMDYDAAIGFYQKSLGLLRLAARRPGG